MCGTKYKVGAVIQTGFDRLLPEFSVIYKIVTVDGDLAKLFFVMEVLSVIQWNDHYHSYEVEKLLQGDLNVYNQEDFVTFCPMHMTTPVDGTGSYVSMKSDTDLMNPN